MAGWAGSSGSRSELDLRGMPAPEGISELLNEAYARLARPTFITDDPIRIPRAINRHEDAEAIGLPTGTAA